MVRAAADMVRLTRSDTRPCHWAFSVLGLSSSLLQWVGPGPPGPGGAPPSPSSQWEPEWVSGCATVVLTQSDTRPCHWVF